MVQYNVSFFIVVTEIGVYIKILQENKLVDVGKIKHVGNINYVLEI